MKQLSLFDLPSSRTIRQQDAVDAWIKNKCVGTINACVGFGYFNAKTAYSAYFNILIILFVFILILL